MKRLILPLLFCCTAAQAEFYTGNDVLSKMEGSHSDKMAMLGYVAGVSDALQKTVHCVPSNVTLGQLHDMFKQHLINFPESRHFTADSLLANLLRANWPCPRRGSGV